MIHFHSITLYACTHIVIVYNIYDARATVALCSVDG